MSAPTGYDLNSLIFAAHAVLAARDQCQDDDILRNIDVELNVLRRFTPPMPRMQTWTADGWVTQEVSAAQVALMVADIHQIRGPMREMVLGDIVEPWVWAYYGHVLPNGYVIQGNLQPLWRSNDPRWHGV